MCMFSSLPTNFLHNLSLAMIRFFMKLLIKVRSRSSQVVASLGKKFVAILITVELTTETLLLASELFNVDFQSNMSLAFLI